MVERGRLRGSLCTPHTVGALNIVVDLRARQVTCSVASTPGKGNSTTKVNWLVGQLENADAKARLECTVLSQRGSGASDLLGRVREKPELLIVDPSEVIRSFTIATMQPMSLKGAAAKEPSSGSREREGKAHRHRG